MEIEYKEDNQFASSIYSQSATSNNDQHPKPCPPKITAIPDSLGIEFLSKMETELSNSP